MKRVCQKLIFTGFLAGFAAVCMGAENLPSVSSLLDQYTRALDSTSSFIHDFECTSKSSYKLQQNSFQGTKYSRGQVRNEGQRLYTTEYSWGDYNNRLRNLPENEPYYDCSVVNDEMFYQNTKHINRTDGSAARVPRREGVETSLSRNSGIGPMLAYIGNDKRLDEILRNAEHISLREKTETINGSQCFVIEANTQYGQFKVWLDSDHGYHPAQVMHKTEAGHYYYDHQNVKGDLSKTYVRNVRFEQIEGVWVPVEAETGSNVIAANEDFVKENCHYKRINIILNPDHEKLGSFADPINENPANDPELQNGTLVRMNHLPITYIWKDGKLIPKIDRKN